MVNYDCVETERELIRINKLNADFHKIFELSHLLTVHVRSMESNIDSDHYRQLVRDITNSLRATALSLKDAGEYEDQGTSDD